MFVVVPKRTNGRMDITGFRRLNVASAEHVFNSANFKYSVVFSGDKVVTLRISDVANSDTDEDTDDCGRCGSDAIKIENVDKFSESLCRALGGAPEVSRNTVGTITRIVVSPNYITKEESEALLRLSAVINVYLIPTGLEINYATLDNMADNLQRMKRKTPERFRPVTAKENWKEERAPGVYLSPAEKRKNARKTTRPKSILAKFIDAITAS